MRLLMNDKNVITYDSKQCKQSLIVCINNYENRLIKRNKKTENKAIQLKQTNALFLRNVSFILQENPCGEYTSASQELMKMFIEMAIKMA